MSIHRRIRMSTPASPAGPTAAESGSRPEEAGPAGLAAAEADRAHEDNASLVRSSGIMAAGTLVSRITGFFRTAVFGYALGAATLADAYNNANTLPNVVYNLALGGILTSVVVPLLVSASKRDADRGEAYDQRIFTLGVIALGAITLVATALAAPLTDLYATSVQGSERSVMVVFAYFFIPQIFFYGVSSLAGAILNARGHFAAPMWTPVVNNVVVIAVGLLFMATAGLDLTTNTISTSEVRLLGIGTTLGIIAQTAALIPALRRVGFRWRPRFDFRRAEVAEIRRMAGWMFGYIATTQVAFLVTTRVANAAARRYRLVSDDFSTGVRLSSVIVVPSALVLAILGPPLAEVLLGYGSMSFDDARLLGFVFAAFSLGLVPYMMFQLLLRVFYAMHDSRTPALIGALTMVVNITANLIALRVLPAAHVVAGLGIGFGISNLVGAIAGWWILSRRIGGLDGNRIGISLVKMHLSAVPCVLFAAAISVMVGAVVPAGTMAALITVVLASSGALLFYVLFAKAFGITELTDLTSTVGARLRR